MWRRHLEGASIPRTSPQSLARAPRSRPRERVECDVKDFLGARRATRCPRAMFRRDADDAPFTIDDEDPDPRRDESRDDDGDNDRRALLASLGPYAPPAHAVSAYETPRDVEIGPGVDADESDLVDDIFDSSEEARANANSSNVFCKCNLASSIMLISSMSLLVYSMVNPAARDAITRFALTSQTERHQFDNIKRDPKTGRPTVELMEGEDEEQEEDAKMGNWWRIESLKGSESPSKDHNQWDLSGLVLYSDYECTKTLTPQAFDAKVDFQSESATHKWQKRTEKGWGLLEGQEGRFIHEPLIGGSRISLRLLETPKCLKIGTCYETPKHHRALLQSSDEADALAAATEENSVCRDTNFPSTLGLYRHDKSTEEWSRMLQFTGTGKSDGVLDLKGAKHIVRTFNFKNAEFTNDGQKYFPKDSP